MNKFIITIMLTVLLSGCVIPVSSSCTSDQPFENSDNGFPPKGQDCSELDAAVYLASALYKETQKQPTKEKPTSISTNRKIKCSDLIGRSKKECQSKKKS
jgi:hypothetical protein